MLGPSRQAAKRLASKGRSHTGVRTFAVDAGRQNPRKEHAPDKEFEFSIGKTPGSFSASFTSWQNIASISHAQCLVREVEKLYGPVTEFIVERVSWLHCPSLLLAIY